MNSPDAPQAIQAMLAELKVEHLDLDEAIGKFEDSPLHDGLLLCRMKKAQVAAQGPYRGHQTPAQPGADRMIAAARLRPLV